MLCCMILYSFHKCRTTRIIKLECSCTESVDCVLSVPLIAHHLLAENQTPRVLLGKLLLKQTGAVDPRN